MMVALMWDVFISHASEDKAVARPLARALAAAGVRVWYDEDVLQIGDSLSEVIDAGLARSNFGIVVLSRHFMAKPWPRRELRGLVAREVQGQKAILPVWHGVSASEVAEFSPPLADAFAVSTDAGLDAIVRKVVQVVGKIPLPPLLDREKQLLRLVVLGMPSAAIGEELGIGGHLAMDRWRRIRDKLGLYGEYETARYAIRIGLVEESEVGSLRRRSTQRKSDA
jgi:DNA-binding CsgD family transcriptional regulator